MSHSRVRQSGFVPSEVIMDAFARMMDDLAPRVKLNTYYPQIKPNTKRAFALLGNDAAGAGGRSYAKKRRFG